MLTSQKASSLLMRRWRRNTGRTMAMASQSRSIRSPSLRSAMLPKLPTTPRTTAASRTIALRSPIRLVRSSSSMQTAEPPPLQDLIRESPSSLMTHRAMRSMQTAPTSLMRSGLLTSTFPQATMLSERSMEEIHGAKALQST